MRQNDDLHMSLHTTSFGHRCIPYKGGKTWNSLPNIIKSERNVCKFKNSLGDYLWSMKC